ncbi:MULTISPECIES: hypothetical protein [Thermoanaerobacterium]|nr:MULTISPECIES: hypothetical protein [Thermoanaerobacterium]
MVDHQRLEKLLKEIEKLSDDDLDALLKVIDERRWEMFFGRNNNK